MNAKAILREYREGNRFDGNLLKGCMAMYRAAGDGPFRDAVLEYLDKGVSSDGQLPALNAGEGLAGKISYGTALLFAWDETGEERYKAAAKQIRDKYTELDRQILPDSAVRGTLHPYQPFVIAYDSRFGDKQSHKAAAKCFRCLRNHTFDKEKKLYQYKPALNHPIESAYDLRHNGGIFLSLADTIEQMDIQLYEHYRVLADLFLEAVRGLIPYRNKTELFARDIINPDSEPDADGNRMAAYALFKGVRLGLLDEEKYLPMAQDLMTTANLHFGVCVSTDYPGQLSFGLMAEAERMEVEKR